MSVTNAIGERIRGLRKKQSLTQAQFADKIKVTRGYLSQLESGQAEPSPIVMLAICNIFFVREDWLRTGEGDMFDDRWGILEEHAKALGEDVHHKFLLMKNKAERLGDHEDALTPGAGHSIIKEAQAEYSFTLNVRGEIAKHNLAIIKKLVRKMLHIFLKDGDYQKTSAVQSVINALGPEDEEVGSD